MSPSHLSSMVPNDVDVLGRQELPPRPEPALIYQPSSPRSHRPQHHSHYPQRQSHQCDEKDPHAYQQRYPNQHQSSFSSTARSSRMADSIDLEKQAAKRQDGDERSSRHSSQNWSKHSRDNNVTGDIVTSASCRVYGDRASESNPRHHTIRHISDDDGEEEHIEPAGLANKAAKLLLFFILVLPVLSLALSLWTVLITLCLFLLHPIRLVFTRRRALSEVVLSLLGPTLNLHLGCIHSFPTAPAELQLIHTVMVLVLAAPISLALSLWSMLLSVYWLFAAVIGNPDGLDGRSDGRELILDTRLKWDDWLRLSVRPEIRS